MTVVALIKVRCVNTASMREANVLLDIAMLLLGVILTAGTFVFVSAEFSLVALDQAVVESRAAAGDARARQVSTAIKNLSTQLSGAQVGITLTTILLGYTTQSALADMLSAAGVGLGLSTAVSSAVGVAVAAVLINVLSMVFGELVPKNLALAHPLKTAGRIVPFNSLFTVVFKPVITVLNASANGILRLMGVEPQEELSSARSASELAAMVRHSAQEGTLDTSTASLFTNSIRISELNAADVMTDRGLLHTIPEDAVASDVVRAAHETGHSRFPVIGEDRDDIIGFVSLRRAVAVPFEKRDEVPVISSSLLAEAPRVPETLDLGTLLVQLREEGLQMAVVVDEYGGVSGIVTFEDVVEEIVGDVADEHDQRRLGIRQRPDGSLLVPGRLRIDELAQRTKIFLPDDGPYDTLAGLIMTELGTIPQVGDRCEVAGASLEVIQMTGRRVMQVSIIPPARESEGEVLL